MDTRAIQYQIINPPAAIADLVRYFWTFEGDASIDSPFTLRTVANGCPELLFHYEGRFEELNTKGNINSFVTGIHGQTNLFRRFNVQKPFGIFGVYLYPHALRTLFNIPAIEFTNHLPDLDSIAQRDWNELSYQMMLAPDNHQRLSIISKFLLEQRKPLMRKEIAYTIRTIIESKGAVDINVLSDQCFRSHRQFERNFKEETGFSAKAFSRIIRFNSVVTEYKGKNVPITEIALDFGYYDHAHFSHDFRAFTGYTPRAYFQGNAPELF